LFSQISIERIQFEFLALIEMTKKDTSRFRKDNRIGENAKMLHIFANTHDTSLSEWSEESY